MGAGAKAIIVITADVLHENKHMQSVFRHSGLKVSSQLRQGVYHFDLDFE